MARVHCDPRIYVACQGVYDRKSSLSKTPYVENQRSKMSIPGTSLLMHTFIARTDYGWYCIYVPVGASPVQLRIS